MATVRKFSPVEKFSVVELSVYCKLCLQDEKQIVP